MAITQPAWWKPRRAVMLTVQGMKHRIHVGAAPEEAIDDLQERWHKKIAERQAEPPPDEARLTADLESVAALGAVSSPEGAS